MNTLKTILKVLNREDYPKGKICFEFNPDTRIVKYLENNSVLQRFRFSSIETDNKSQKQFVETIVTAAINGFQAGVDQIVFVVGTNDCGKNYLLKGSNSTPGIVSSIERRLALLGSELKQTSNLSYLRYINGSFWDILNSSRSSISLSQNLDLYSFTGIKTIPIKDIMNLSTIESTIGSNLNSTYILDFPPSSVYHSLWLFSTRMKKNGAMVTVTLAIVDTSLEGILYCVNSYADKLDGKYLQPLIDALRHTTSPQNYIAASPFITSLIKFSQSFSLSTVIACIDTVPTPLTLSVLQSLSDTPSDQLEKEIQRKCYENKQRIKSSALCDDAITLLSSSSDSFVESDESDDDDVCIPDTSRTVLTRLSLYETPKKAIKRMSTQSDISDKIVKCGSFSPQSRLKINQNEYRLSTLMNGIPVISPCSRIIKAKQLIMLAKELESHGQLSESIHLYEEGDLLPNNDRLKEKVKDVMNRIQLVVTTKLADDTSADNEKKVLEVINFSGLSGLMTLKTIGQKKADSILKERENGIFSSVDDLKRIGLSEKAIARFRIENVN